MSCIDLDKLLGSTHERHKILTEDDALGIVNRVSFTDYRSKSVVLIMFDY